MNGEKDEIWADLMWYDLDDDEDHHGVFRPTIKKYPHFFNNGNA